MIRGGPKGIRFLLLPRQREWLERRLIMRRARERALVALLEDTRADTVARVALEVDLVETRASIARTRYLLNPLDPAGLAAAV